jgi:glycosyltransferase involved in cell wall biosynthesis
VRVSTIVLAFNAERTIAQTIDSALAQRFDGHEIVVVNDGSDSTTVILEKYGYKITVPTQPNRGAAAVQNAGVTRLVGLRALNDWPEDRWSQLRARSNVLADCLLYRNEIFTCRA